MLCATIFDRRTYFSHAKAQSFAKRLRGSASSACNIFDIRTKVHNASRPLRLCVRFFHTELKVAVRTCEGKAIHGNTQNHTGCNYLTQTAQTFAEACGANFVDFCECVQIFRYSVRAAVTYKKSKKVRFLTRLGGIWISRKYVVYLYREKEILPQRGYLLHFCPIFWVKKGKITRHMRKNMCRII